MFILYAGGIHFNLSTGVNVGLEKSTDYLLGEFEVKAYPTITLDLKLGYRFTLNPRWFLDWNFFNLNLSPNFNLMDRHYLSLSVALLRFGTIINKWSVYGLIDPLCIQGIIFMNRDVIKKSFSFGNNLGWGIAIGAGASYQCLKYLSPNIELQYRAKFTGQFCQSFIGLIGIEVHSSKYSQE